MIDVFKLQICVIPVQIWCNSSVILVRVCNLVHNFAALLTPRVLHWSDDDNLTYLYISIVRPLQLEVMFLGLKIGKHRVGM